MEIDDEVLGGSGPEPRPAAHPRRAHRPSRTLYPFLLLPTERRTVLALLIHYGNLRWAESLHAAGVEGPHSALRGIENTGTWLESWQDFAAVLLLPLYAVALGRRVASRTARWFDLILPALVLFFFFYPDSGGFQYGPRYWYFGYVPLPLSTWGYRR